MKGIIAALLIEEDSIEKATFVNLPGQSKFMQLFNDVLEDLGRFYWICPDGPFSSQYAQNEKEMDFYYSSLTVAEIAEPYSLFPVNARWIRDDDNILLGFKERPDNHFAKMILERLCCDDEFIDTNVDVFLSNQDASFWEIFVNDDSFVEKCLKSVVQVVDRKYVTLLDFADRNKFYAR